MRLLEIIFSSLVQRSAPLYQLGKQQVINVVDILIDWLQNLQPDASKEASHPAVSHLPTSPALTAVTPIKDHDVDAVLSMPERKPIAKVNPPDLIRILAEEPFAWMNNPTLDESLWQRRPDKGKPVSVLLINLPPAGLESPPLRIAQLATYIRCRGHAVEVLDLNIHLHNHLRAEWQLLWDSANSDCWRQATLRNFLLDKLRPYLNQYAEYIAAHPAPLVGAIATEINQSLMVQLIQSIKSYNSTKRFILDGPICITAEERRVLLEATDYKIDGFVVGEGEQIISDAIEAFRSERELAEVPGLRCYDQERELPSKAPRRLIPLDQVPFPTFEDFNSTSYQSDELDVEWSRGCIASCTFCPVPQIDGKFRSHSALAIFSSLRRYQTQFGIRRFRICDPIINGDLEILREVCQLIRKEKIDVEWRGNALPHPGLTSDLLGLMREAGCMELSFGLESGSNVVLEYMGKREFFSVASAAQVMRDCHAAGIRTNISIMVGFPGEGEAEFLETYHFLRHNSEVIDRLTSIRAFELLPNTMIFQAAERHGIRFPNHNPHRRWFTEDGNTLEERLARVRRLQYLVQELGIVV